MAKVEGGDLMLFYDGKSIAYATNHTLSISGETQDTSNKDEGGGGWASEEVSILSWTVSSDNLYSEDGEGNNFEDLFDLMVAKQPITAVFAKKAESAVDVPTGGWTPKSNSGYTGQVVITSLELNAPNGEKATYTVQFNGVGALTKIS